MIGVFIFNILIICLVFLWLWRSKMIFKYRKIALEKTSKQAKDAISRHEPWKHFYQKLEACGTHNQMVFDIRKWKYDQFYPGL